MNRSTRCTLARLLVIQAVLLLISPMVADAGVETGVIEGVVTDNRNIPLPGVTVTVSGPALEGERKKAVTDGEGHYRIPGLPVADGYEAHFMLGREITVSDSGIETSAGWQTIIQTDISVTRGGATTVDASLAPAVTSSPRIEIYDPPPLIPGGSSMITEVFTSRFLDTLPNGRSWLDAVAMMPGVAGLEEPYRRGYGGHWGGTNDFSPFHVHGADATDNIFLVDGVETTNTVFGKSGMPLPWEAIKEVEVHTGGLPAEYGRAVGGMVNVVTRSGGNQFHGSVPVYYTSLDLEQDQDEDHGPHVTDDYEDWEYGGSLSGPLVCDHLWFFAAYDHYGSTIEGSDPYGTTIEHEEVYQQGLANLVWQASPDHKLKAQYAHSPAERHYDDSPSQDVPALLEWGNELYDLKWTGILHPDVYVEARVAHHNSYTTLGPKYEDWGNARITDYHGGAGERTVTGNVSSITDVDRPRRQYQASVNWYRGDWAGDHSFKFGAEYQDLEYEETLIYPESYTINRPYDRPDIWLNRTDITYLDTGSILTLYAQDDWAWRDDWTFNLGLRWERQEQANDVGEEVYTFDSLISPRLGVSWDVLGDGRSRLFAHIGRYHDTVGLYLASVLNRQIGESRRYEGDYETDDWEQINYIRDPENPDTVDDSLDPNFKDEIVVGYEFEFLTDFAAGARLIVNRQNNMIENVLANEDEIRRGENTMGNYIFHITNVDSARRDYRGLELSLKKQISNNYQFLAVYTLSESKGSVVYGTTYAEGLSTYADIAETYYNRYGNLPWDDQQYLKFNGSYHLPLGFIVGTSFNWRSGRPYNRVSMNLPESSGYIYGYAGQYYLDPRGSHRLGSAWWIDLRLRKDFEAGPTTISLTADAFNLSNNQHVIGVNEIYFHDPGYTEHGEPNKWMRAGYFVLGGKLTF